MNDGSETKQILEINFCALCKCFFTSTCFCAQNFTNSEVLLLPFTNVYINLSLMKKIVCVVLFAIYNCANKLLKATDDISDNSPMPRKAIAQSLKRITSKYSQEHICSKYIYMLPNEPVQPKNDICVYMMSELEKASNQDQPRPPQLPIEVSPESSPRNDTVTSASTSSLASKKSTSMLSKLSKTLKRKKKSDEPTGDSSRSETKQSGSLSLHSASKIQKYRSKSKIPVPKRGFKLQKFENEDMETLLSPKSPHKPRSFFRKLVAKQPDSKSNSSQNTSAVQSAEKTKSNLKLPQHEQQCESYLKMNQEPSLISQEERVCRGNSSYSLITNFIGSKNCESAIGDLREVNEFSQRLQESESHLTHVIAKYIQDQSFQNELRNALSNHAKLHMEAERRAQNLAQEMWLQQSEMMKAQETTTQENLNAVLKQNRHLQEDLESLTKKNEKLVAIRTRHLPDYDRHDSSHQLIENLSKNNDKLRYKLSAMLAQLEENEKELKIQQRRNQFQEQQLRNSHSQLQTHKTMLQRVRADNELEQAHLSHQLQLSQLTVKESVEAGDVLLEDMDALKRQLKSMPCALNWTKFKSRGSSLPDLIYMCRSCINELAKEITSSHTEIILRDKDISAIKDETKRLEETLENSKSEQERLSNQLKIYGVHEVDLKKYKAKCASLEHELSEHKQHIENASNEFEKEKLQLIASVDGVEQLNRKVIEKEEELILNKEKMCQYKSENDALRMQLHGLKQVLSASGSGDVARELADIQEKKTYFQSQYYQVLSEKDFLVQQLQSANVEREALNQFQNNYYQFIQKQQRDVETLNSDNLALRQKLEMERSHVSSLQTDKNKLKEEKNVMRQIYQQLKSEISRVQKLQGEMAGVSSEANRLAIIAEYNKQLGEKLQCEVAERDEKIFKLETSVEKLNVAQLENTKDKVALCVELNEVCTINDQLNKSLVAEHQKSVHLDESKKKIETSATTQLKAVEEMQKTERAALKELLKDYKNVVTQRDNLVAAQNEYHQQITDLRANALAQNRNLEGANIKCMHALENIEKLEKKLKESEKVLRATRDKIVEKDQVNTEIRRELQQLKTEKEALESSKTYLQNTIQNLHNDLNQTRKAEQELKQTVKDEAKKGELIEFTINQNVASLTQVNQEKEKLTLQLAELNKEHEKLLADSEANKARVIEAEANLQKNLEETNGLMEKSDNELQRLEKIIAEKDAELLDIKDYCETLVEQLKALEISVEDIETQSKLLSESNTALVKLQVEHKGCFETISTLEIEKRMLETELKSHLNELETNYSYHQKCVEEVMKDYTDQKEEMVADVETMKTKLQNAKKDCENERTAHNQLLDAHKSLAGKLLKAVRMLIDEKLRRETAEANFASLTEQASRLASEKAAIGKTVELMSGELEELRTRMGELISDKKSLQELLSDLQELYKKAQLTGASEQPNSKKRRKALTNKRSNISLVLKDTKSSLQASEERTKKLKSDLENSYKTIMELKSQISDLKQQLTIKEFQKCEIALRLHETEAKLKTEQTINKEYMDINQQVLNEILRLKREGIITRPATETLLVLVQGQPEVSTSNPKIKEESVVQV